MAKSRLYSFILSVIIPFAGVFGGIYFFRFSDQLVMGFPILYFWLFLWFVLTSLCLTLAWYLFDRYDDEDYQASKEK